MIAALSGVKEWVLLFFNSKNQTFNKIRKASNPILEVDGCKAVSWVVSWAVSEYGVDQVCTAYGHCDQLAYDIYDTFFL